MINASLGAHYSSQLVHRSIGLWWRTLLGLPVTDVSSQLQAELEATFGGQAVLVYKGRDAIELALRGFGINTHSQTVLTQAFTCHAIEEAITRAGAHTHYVDLGKNQLNLTVETLSQAYKQAKNVKAVIVQNTLGHPAEMAKLAAWCKKHEVLLIEDLAQSYGATANGKLLGTFGDAVILSFGRDKVIDAVSGGAVIFRQKPTQSLPKLPSTPKSAVLSDLAYPFFTWLIRSTYDVLLGKVIHKVLTVTGIMNNPTQSRTNMMTALPASLALLALWQLKQVEMVRRIRQVTAALYLEKLTDTPIKLLTKTAELKTGSLLRVAATIDKPQALLALLRAYNIHLTDRWYRTPVDCGQLKCETHYQAGSCPNAEKMSDTIINLPTHAKISLTDAEKIISIIKQFFAPKK